MHWLRDKPSDVTGALHHTMITVPEEAEKFSNQAARDWETILLARGKELAPGKHAQYGTKFLSALYLYFFFRHKSKIIFITEFGPFFLNSSLRHNIERKKKILFLLQLVVDSDVIVSVS